ncbi:MAG: hypothetical protein Q8K82_18275 [Gemmatimonadaceae bacterium]|nr:hypothetical protein [Gemmatimonadaceae bacterium]
MTDRLAVVTLHGTATLLKDFNSLLSCARATTTADDFRRRVDLAGYMSQKAKSQNKALLAILRAQIQGGLDEDRYWQFLRVISVLSFDLGTVTAQSEAIVMTLLAHVATDEANPAAAANVAWTKLLDVASEGRQAAASYHRGDLPAELLERHHAVPGADERARLDLVVHGRTVREGIRTTIARDYTLDRAALASAMLDAIEEVSVVVVAGAAGSGKSALAKSLLDRVEIERPVLAFQAVEFATAHINETLAKTQTTLNARSLLALLAAHDRTTVLVDGVERLLEHSVRDAFTQLLKMVAETKSLRLVLTCRDYSLDTVRSALLDPAGLVHRVVEVGTLSDEELDAVAEGVRALAPPLGDVRMRGFLRTPYLLDMAARLDWVGAALPDNVRALREKCWRELVRDEAHPGGGMPARREAAFIDIARRRATELRPYVIPWAQDPEALDALREASLLGRSAESDKLYAPAHDVLEDWAILKWFDDVAVTAEDPAAGLADAVSGLPAMRRGIRRWLAERLEIDALPARELVLTVSARSDLPPYFRDDCIVAALLSDAASAFLEGCRQRIETGDKALLWQVVHLLRVACKSPPHWLPVGGLPSSMLVPVGPAWPPVLALVANHLPCVPDGDALLCLGLLEDWSRQLNIASPAPSGADAAGRIATGLLSLFHGYGFDDARERSLKVVLMIPSHAPAFEDLSKRARDGDRDDREAHEFCDLVLSSLSGAFACRDYPDEVIDIARTRLMLREASHRRSNWSSLGIDEFFGLAESVRSDFFPASAAQGPFRALLRHHTQKALKFIIELLNHAGDWYGRRMQAGHDLEPAELITIDVPGTGPVTQWMNGRLYTLFRGMSVGPYVLQSALMALEAWLLQLAEVDGFDLEAWLLFILRESNNVMATGVVASVCIAHPKRAGRAALAVLSSRAIIECDKHRMVAEASASAEFLVGINASHALFEMERRKANALAHRREDLESLALRLQLTDHRDAVWALIDRHRAALANEDDERTLIWRLALHRMDMRGFRVATEQPPVDVSEPDGGKRVYLEPGNLEPEVQGLVDANQDRMARIGRHLRLKQAAERAWDNRNGPESADWKVLLADAQSLEMENDAMEEYARGGPGVAAAVCIRGHLLEMSPEERAWCVARVVREIKFDAGGVDLVDAHSRMFGPDRAAGAVIPLLVAQVPTEIPMDGLDLLAHALTHPVDEVAAFTFGGAGAFLDREYDDLLLRCVAAAVSEATCRRLVREAEREEGLFGSAQPSDSRAQVTQAVRLALAGSTDEARATLSTIDFSSWEGRKAAKRVFTLLKNRPGWPESRLFARRAADWLAEVWGRGRHQRGDRDFHSESDLSGRLAKYALTLPEGPALDVCAPLIALAATAPDEVASFLENLIVAADGGADDSFWPLWQAFADGAADAEWTAQLRSKHPHGQKMIDRLFLATYWKDDTTHWPRLEGNAQRVHALVHRLPPASAYVHAYVRFLYTIGQRQLPDAFIDVDELLRRVGDVASASKSETAFYLESLLGRFVYAQPFRLKRDARLRDAVLRLLDALVSSGSSAAYRMRDDFVTPLPSLPPAAVPL